MSFNLLLLFNIAHSSLNSPESNHINNFQCSFTHSFRCHRCAPGLFEVHCPPSRPATHASHANLHFFSPIRPSWVKDKGTVREIHPQGMLDRCRGNRQWLEYRLRCSTDTHLDPRFANFPIRFNGRCVSQPGTAVQCWNWGVTSRILPAGRRHRPSAQYIRYSRLFSRRKSDCGGQHMVGANMECVLCSPSCCVHHS